MATIFALKAGTMQRRYRMAQKCETYMHILGKYQFNPGFTCVRTRGKVYFRKKLILSAILLTSKYSLQRDS